MWVPDGLYLKFNTPVICCVFTKSSFRLYSYFDILCTSDLFPTQLCTSLLSFKLHLSFYLSSICSLFFPSTLFCFFRPPLVLLFDHSLYLGTCSSFFVFACEYLLHVIFFVPCYILPFPSLTVSCDISCV